MDIHERFMAYPTTEIVQLFNLKGDKCPVCWEDIILPLVIRFNNGLQTHFANEDSWEDMKTLHTVLCSLYQNNNRQKLLDLLWKVDIKGIERIFESEKLNSKVLPYLCGIVVLYMVDIYSGAFWKEFGEFETSVESYFIEEKDIKPSSITMMVCHLDSLRLYKLKNELYYRHDEFVRKSLLKMINMWLAWTDREKWKLHAQVLPKMLQANNSAAILKKVWEMVPILGDDLGDILSILCITADTWFPNESVYDKQLVHQAVEEPFWLLLIKGLSSSISQYRKQALYLTKRVVDFTEKHRTEGLELSDYREIRPLICTGTESQQDSFRRNLNNFFLILEALEEKQKHLVQPVLPLLKKLLHDTFQQETHTAGFHVAWIRCVFLRILQHDNNAVVKWGLLNVLTLDPELYNDEFLSNYLDVLNNSYLYENEMNEEEPSIVKALTKFLNIAEMKNSDLVTRFMIRASQITWGPVALFYVIHSLSRVERVQTNWEEVELKAVKSLAENNLTMHCRILRMGSQIELLEALINFTTESLDLVSVANTLSAFSTNEALIRGQLAWKRTVAWLSKIVNEEEAVRLLGEISKQMANGNTPSDLNVKSFSLMIMLFYDGHLILKSKLCPGFTALRNLLNCLIEAASRPTINTKLITNTIQLLNHLLEFMTSNDKIFWELISEYIDATVRFIFKRLRTISNDTSIDDINAYTLVTQHFLTAQNSIIRKIDVSKHMERFETESWNIIEDGECISNLRRLFGIKILYACLGATNKKCIDWKFIGPLCNTYKTFMTQVTRSEEEVNDTRTENTSLRGTIAAEYCRCVAELFHMYVEYESADDWIPDINWIEQVSYLIQVGRKEIFVPLIGILSQIFYKEAVTATNMDEFKSVLRLCWRCTLESNDCRLALEDIVELMLSSPFLEREETRELTLEFSGEVVEKGEKIPGLCLILLQDLWRIKGEYVPNFYEALLSCLLYGSVPRRDQKIELQARSYIYDCYEKVYPNYLSNMNVNTDTATRANAVTLLHRMITDDPTHGAKLLPLIMAQLDKSHNKRYFGDSQIHRIKNRIIQVLLVLQPALEEDEIESLHSLMCKNMLSESSQPSIRMMQEWLLIKIYLECDALRAKIWDLFDQGQEKRVGSLCSVMSVVYHLARLLSSNLKLDFINQAFQHIMQCCMAQQFNVRLYAQVIAFKLYDLAANMSYSTITEKYREFHAALKKSLKYGNLMKNSVKLQDDFYLTVFHPINDYSLQTIFYELPRLSNIASDEYIAPQMFEKFGFKQSNSHSLKLLNLNSDMSEAMVSEHVSKSSGTGAGPAADGIDMNVECSTDMQKKFIPWKRMMPNEEELNEVSGILGSHRKAFTEENNIILVASLVEKLPNLGGLSRTCEILGVKEFVISSIKHTEEKEFQSLSVSAEKLITLVEVKPHQLPEYLLQKKNVGYHLVGAEQTANSTSLVDMKFNKKTVLLLGNEKAGIPVNLIPLLDQCVEIPQVGLVRSFNVHVTGAMCLWEYFKQHRKSS